MVVSPSSARTSSAFLRLAAGPDARGRAPVVVRGTAFGAGATAAGSVEGCGPVIARRSHDPVSCSDASSSPDSSEAFMTVDALGASGALVLRAEKARHWWLSLEAPQR
jgi:hypothetical protein